MKGQHLEGGIIMNYFPFFSCINKIQRYLDPCKQKINKGAIMECPKCKYEDRWLSAKEVWIKGTEGDFFRLPISLERKSDEIYYREKDTADVYGCPNCNNVFMSQNRY